MNDLQSVYLSSLGLLNAMGNSRQQVLNNMIRGQSSGIKQRADLLLDGNVFVGMVNATLPVVQSNLSKYDSRNSRLLLAAYQQIAVEVDELISRYGRDRIAVVLGTSTSGINECEDAIYEYMSTGTFPPQYKYEQQEFGSTSEFLAEYLGLKNVAITVSTACSSSAKAFSSAKNLIQSNICDAVLVGGVDSLCKLTINGFSSLNSLSSSICNPASCNRDGITIGEAAALFILSKDPIGPRLLGVGESSDAYQISSPHPEGVGAENAMRKALKNSSLTSKDINYINMHGTATLKNDEMENRAIHRVFGGDVPCSSTKALTGHTLGAAGATELALCWLSLSSKNKNGYLPPHIWDGEPDISLPQLNLTEIGSSVSHSNNLIFMSNSFAFGGSNVSVIIGACLE